MNGLSREESSVGPPVLEDLAAVVGAAGAEREQLEAVLPALEGPRDPRRDTDRIEPFQLDDVVVQLHPAGAGKDDVDLLDVVVPVPKRLPAARLDPVMTETGLLGLQILVREAGLLTLREAELHGRILDVGQVQVRVGSAHRWERTAPYSRRVVPPLTFQAWLRWDTVERLLPPDARTVLEIGAGMGAVGSLLARRYEYLGLEPDAMSFTVARRRIEAAGGRAEQTDYAGLGPGREFDLVCAFEVLEHLEDDAAALAAWRELVRPGGHVLLSVPGAPGLYGASDERAGHFRRYERHALRDALERAGFDDVRIVAYGFPVGYPLKKLRDALAARDLRRRSGTRAQRTASSGRWLQPDERLAPLTAAAALPFRYLQRPFSQTALGTGLVASARRRLRSNE